MTTPPTPLAPPACGAPLAGLRILDLTRLLPGPLATQHLADLGADVIKIEDLGAGDYASPHVRGLLNRNKRAVRLDLKQPAGCAALRRLVAGADALVEGFRPGVMDRLGLGYAALAAVNPKLVFCSISGWGQEGPLRDEPGHDINYAALAGVAQQVGNAQGPALSNLPLADLLGGTSGAVMGLLAALLDAQRSGRGRHVDVAMADAVLAHAVLPLAELRAHGHVSAPGQATLTGALACYGLYDTADGRQLAVGALEAKFWRALCEAIARPDLIARHRSGSPEGEAATRAELAAVFASQPLAHWAAVFRHAGACVTPVLRLDETLQHPHFIERGMVRGDVAGGAPELGIGVKMSGFQPPAPRPAPQPGEHTDALLAEAGYSPGEIAALRTAGAAG